MNIEKDWPTLVEANHVKSVKKKYNIKKKSNWIKINAGINFNKSEDNAEVPNIFESSNEAIKKSNGCNIMKGIKHLHINKSNLIRHFDNSEELYNYHEDSNTNCPRQRTMCKLVPVKHNMASILTDVRVNEIYYGYFNEYLPYVNSGQGDMTYQDITVEYNDKMDCNSQVTKVSIEKITNQTDENEIMYVRSNVLSYYFSEMNLYNDKYLVSIMDEDGWVCLDILLKFPRLLKTQTSLEDIPNIIKNIKYPEFYSELTKLGKDAILELKQDYYWKIRRSDMTKFRINLQAFSNTNDYKPRQHELPFPKYTYNYFLNNLDNICSNLLKEKYQDGFKNYDWKEVKPKVRRSRKSESCLNENQNNLNVDNQDNLDFEFSSEPNPLQSRNNPNIRRKQANKRSMERSRSRTISGGSEDELDESNIYILSMRPKMTYAKILDWADVSDSDDDEDSEMQIPRIQPKLSTMSQRLLAKHPSGDRHPNPDYQTRSKIQEQLREIISDGLRDWKNNNEIIRRNRHDSSSSASSDIKVQICHDEKAFKLMQKSLQNHDIMDYIEGPNPPSSTIPIEQKVEIMKHKPVNVMHFKPLTEDTDMVDYEFLSESSISSLLNPVHYDSWAPSFTINPSLNQLLDKLLENVQYQYLNIEKPIKFTKKLSIKTDKIIPNNPPNEKKLKETENPSSILINDIHKEIRKIKRSCKVGFYPVTKVGPAKDKHKDKTRASTQPIIEYDVGYAYSGKQSGRRQRTFSGSTYSQYNDAGYAVAHGIPIPFNDHPSQLLLQENGFEIKFYHVFRKESLADREKRGIGRSQEMNTLFRFWSFFLRENKNKIMYEEFQKYAWEDALKGYRYGVECLFRMYTYKLEQRRHFNELQYQDFQKNVLKDLENNHLYGLEKFWAFLKYSGRKLEVHPRIKKLLEKYKTLDDFRINFIPPQGFHSYKIEYPDQTAVESGIESE